MATEDKFKLIVNSFELYKRFRKIFDKLPNRETKVKILVEKSKDFGPNFFDGNITEEEVVSTFELISSCRNSLSSIEMQEIYDYII